MRDQRRWIADTRELLSIIRSSAAEVRPFRDIEAAASRLESAARHLQTIGCPTVARRGGKHTDVVKALEPKVSVEAEMTPHEAVLLQYALLPDVSAGDPSRKKRGKAPRTGATAPERTVDVQLSDPVPAIDQRINAVLQRPEMFAIDSAQGLDSVIQTLMGLRCTFRPVDRAQVRRDWFGAYFGRETGNAAAFDLLRQRFEGPGPARRLISKIWANAPVLPLACEPPGYLVDDGSPAIERVEHRVLHATQYEQRTPVSYQPVVISRRLVDVSSSTIRIEVQFSDWRGWHALVRDRSHFTPNTIIETARWGMPVRSENARSLADYLREYEVCNRDHIPLLWGSQQQGAPSTNTWAATVAFYVEWVMRERWMADPGVPA